jgi:hypothetical protein
VLPASRAEIAARLADGDLVLDVGGWAKPLHRADWVIDLMPHASRGLYGDLDPEPERFTAETWVQADICASEAWPFADGQFDFAVCSQTLEDVRDPVRVCEELSRVARAGYVEVPSRLEEQAWGVHGEWVGWAHHHWLVDAVDGGLEFVFKSGILADRPAYTLTREQAEALTPSERVLALFWEGTLAARERIFFDPDELERHLAAPVAAARAELESRIPPTRRRLWGRS